MFGYSVFVDGAKASDPTAAVQKPKSEREQYLAALWKALLSSADNTAISVNTDGGSFTFESRETIMNEIRKVEREVLAEKGMYRRRVMDVGL